MLHCRKGINFLLLGFQSVRMDFKSFSILLKKISVKRSRWSTLPSTPVLLVTLSQTKLQAQKTHTDLLKILHNYDMLVPLQSVKKLRCFLVLF